MVLKVIITRQTKEKIKQGQLAQKLVITAGALITVAGACLLSYVTCRF